jgi:hypothetical protein
LEKRAQDSPSQVTIESEFLVGNTGKTNFSKIADRVKASYAELKLRFLDDLYDSILGVSVCLAIYLHFFDYVVLGFSLAFMGILFGGFDWILRNRTPFYLKVMSFLSFGGYYFYTGFTRF